MVLKKYTIIFTSSNAKFNFVQLLLIQILEHGCFFIIQKSDPKNYQKKIGFHDQLII
jgi:hypothetical protein